MATKEEIREGIDMRAPIPQVLNRVFLDFLADYDGYKAGVLSEHLDFYIARAITNAMHGLHSQGVVIKAERELSEDFICDDYMNGLGFLTEHGRTPTYLELDRFIRALGYVATNSLI